MRTVIPTAFRNVSELLRFRKKNVPDAVAEDLGVSK
jgi:hypothetical protein